MDGKLYIKKFIRDDGEILSFDGEEIYLAEQNTLLVLPDPNTTAVNYTEADGGEMIHQQNTTYDQTINGLIVPRTTDYWTLRGRLSFFFRINHTYKIVYVKKDGSMFITNGAWIGTGLQIIPVPGEEYSSWTITLTIGDVTWTEYSEDSEGREIYSNNVTIPLLSLNPGGEIWDQVGEVWDSVGGAWEEGSGGLRVINVATTRAIYPIWEVTGPCTNPTLQNDTTDSFAEFDGSIGEGQTLVVDFTEGTAYIGTARVNRYLYGSVRLGPGDNIVGFSSEGGDTEECIISWNNIVN